MELRKAEPFGILDHHHRSVRHVDPNLDDCGGDKHLDLPGGKFFHDLIFLFSLHLPVKVLHPDPRQILP